MSRKLKLACSVDAGSPAKLIVAHVGMCAKQTRIHVKHAQGEGRTGIRWSKVKGGDGHEYCYPAATLGHALIKKPLITRTDKHI